MPIAEKSEQPRGQRARGYRKEGADHRGFYSSVACDRPQTFAMAEQRNQRMADAKYDVLGIGNAIFDVLVKTDEKFLSRHGMTKGGMSLIDETRAASIGWRYAGRAATSKR